MNRKQSNRLEMFNTVSATMHKTENASLWGGVPAVVQCMTEFDGKITAIQAKATKQEAPISGAAEQKHNVRGDFEDSILEIAHQISALGAANHDMELQAAGDLTLSQLDNMTDDELEDTGTRIAGLVLAHQPALEDYGLVGDDLDALNALKSEFHDMKTAPRTAVTGRKGETDTLPQLLKDTTTLLRLRLDKLMTPFKKKNPALYAAYQSARVIVDKGAPAAAKQVAPPKQPS